MSIITKTDNGIIYKLKDELVCIEAYGRDIIRVRITRNSTLSDEKWTLLDVEDCSFETEITGGESLCNKRHSKIGDLRPAVGSIYAFFLQKLQPYSPHS